MTLQPRDILLSLLINNQHSLQMQLQIPVTHSGGLLDPFIHMHHLSEMLSNGKATFMTTAPRKFLFRTM